VVAALAWPYLELLPFRVAIGVPQVARGGGNLSANGFPGEHNTRHLLRRQQLGALPGGRDISQVFHGIAELLTIYRRPRKTPANKAVEKHFRQ
jgi:hypothetical protein